MGAVGQAGFDSPEPLTAKHRLDAFRCNEAALEAWLKQRALKNQGEGASRTFVLAVALDVIGYYALAAGSVMRAAAPGGIRRNMPEPIPVVVLGRLAVHADWEGRGIGSGLLKDAVQRTVRLSREMGIRALLCHAIGPDAKRFYLHHGFVESPIDPLTVMLDLGRGI